MHKQIHNQPIGMGQLSDNSHLYWILLHLNHLPLVSSQYNVGCCVIRAVTVLDVGCKNTQKRRKMSVSFSRQSLDCEAGIVGLGMG